MSTYLFVYGTLRATFVNPPATRLRQYSQYVGEGVLTGQLYDVGSYPGALYIPGSDELIHGSVYELVESSTVELLRVLDEYEGVQTTPSVNTTGEYVRRVVPVTCAGLSIDCWAYLYNWPVDALRRIKSGNYVLYTSK